MSAADIRSIVFEVALCVCLVIAFYKWMFN